MRRSPLARPLTALAAAVLVSGVLAGCSGISIGGGCTPVLPSGDSSSIVTASGDVGDEPAVEFPTPLRAAEAERSVLVAGDGAEIGSNQIVDAYITVFDGVTGDVLQATDYTAGPPSRFTTGDEQGALGRGLMCATVGSRVVITGPVESFAPASAEDDAEAAEAEPSGDSYIVVVDILKVWLGKANGINQLPQDGMPTVVTAVDGTPGVTVSTQSPPSELRVATIKAGGGDTLAEGDFAVMHVRSWTWAESGTVTVGSVDTWGEASPQNYEIDTTVPVLDALIGAKVGSQVLMVVPADEEGGTATIYVFDILGIDHDQ